MAVSCYELEASHPNKIWQSDDILSYFLPTLAMQIAINIFASNLFHCILRRFHQPRLVADVLAGLTLSLIMTNNNTLGKLFTPTKTILNIETYINMGLMFYVFLTGLEINLNDLLHIQKKATSIAIAGVIIPAVIGMGFFALVQKVYKRPEDSYFREDDKHVVKAYLFWSLALTITGFPVLARILTNLKLLYSGLGKTALATAMMSGTYGWILFIILIPFTNNNARAIWSVLSTITFILFCIFALRPLIMKFINQKMEQDTWDESQLLLVLMGTFACSYITDALGTHHIVGAFVYGLILPHGRFSDLVMGKIDDFVSGVISPLFFFHSGFKINLFLVAKQNSWPIMAFVILLLSIPKVISTVVATFFFGMPIRDGVGIGLLLNSKGVLALIIMNVAKDRKILSEVACSIMLSAIILMTIIAPLFINAIYKPRKLYEKYRLRTIERLRFDSELRVVSCVHNIRQAAGMVNVLKTFNASRISPMHVFGIHLVEPTGRATTAALFAAHMDQPINTEAQNLTQSQVMLEGITITFNALAEANNAVRVETLNAVSIFETIHEDIYGLAEQNRTTLILVPFHSQPDIEACQETKNETYRDINLNVLRDAPCSVAVFVERGIGSFSKNNLRIVMLFVGGPDDREALAIAWRMGMLQGNQLSMVRILLRGEAAEVDTSVHDKTQWLSSTTMGQQNEKALDDEFIDTFRFKAVYKNDSITYTEEEVHNSEELTLLLHELDKDGCDLYVIGQGSGRNSIIFSNSFEWCDNPELGVIGDTLASNSFGSRSSLLVVQQFGYGGMAFGAQSRQPRQFPTNSDGSNTLVVNTI